MKLIPISVIAACVLAGCSGSEKPATSGLAAYADSSSPVAPVRAEPDTTLSPTLPPVTSQGIGPLRLGMSPAMMPSTLAGVYDSLSVTTQEWEGDSYLAIEGYLNSLKTIETLAIADSNRIEALTLTGSRAPLNAAGTTIRIGSPASAVKAVKGMEELSADSYMWRGITIYIAADTVTAFSVSD